MVRLRTEIGQTTAEYALVLLAAALIAFILIAWASNDEAGLSDFFSSIIADIQGRIPG
ncbi:MAG: DUF4244 domain-containing protein [Actinomycetota bacterium]